jgi:hypothetical protein
MKIGCKFGFVNAKTHLNNYYYIRIILSIIFPVPIIISHHIHICDSSSNLLSIYEETIEEEEEISIIVFLPQNILIVKITVPLL